MVIVKVKAIVRVVLARVIAIVIAVIVIIPKQGKTMVLLLWDHWYYGIYDFYCWDNYGNGQQHFLILSVVIKCGRLDKKRTRWRYFLLGKSSN